MDILTILFVITGFVAGFLFGLIFRKPPNPEDCQELYLGRGINDEPEFYFAVTPEFIKDVKNKKYVTFKLIQK